MFLGGNTPYKKEFKRYPGTYYVSAGWHEEKIEMIEVTRSQSGQCLQAGLGIDADGTYTDAVVFDLVTQNLRSKNKALTTK